MPQHRLQARLTEDLRQARRGRDARAAAAIGSVLTALANAEAVPTADGPYAVVEGRADVPRRRLAPQDIEAMVAGKIDEREQAISEYRCIGADSRDLEAELATLERYRSSS